MNKVFEHDGDPVNIKVAHNLMRRIAEGSGEDDEDADSQLRSSAVDSYLQILGEPKLPSILLQVICWVLGEYGTADGKYSAQYIIGKLCDVAEAHLGNNVVMGYVTTAIMKIRAFEITAGKKVTKQVEAEASDIYDILMDDNQWKGFSQSNAKISKEVGGSFSLFDGAITGVNQELQQGKLIVQKWRFSNWIDGHYSTVYMTFEEPDSGVIIVKLKQTDVPEKDRYGNATVVENTERGWKELIFHEI